MLSVTPSLTLPNCTGGHPVQSGTVSIHLLSSLTLEKTPIHSRSRALLPTEPASSLNSILTQGSLIPVFRPLILHPGDPVRRSLFQETLPFLPVPPPSRLSTHVMQGGSSVELHVFVTDRPCQPCVRVALYYLSVLTDSIAAVSCCYFCQ